MSGRSVGVVLCLQCCLVGCATKVRTQHYLGVFDPQQQVPAELYKISIEGDAGWASNVEYGSGWVPASEADLLTYDIRSDDHGKFAVTGSTSAPVDVRARRRFFEIGPAGVSTAPENGRFVVVMSADPDYFFKKLGMLTRFGNADDSAIEKSRQAVLAELREKRIDAVQAISATQKELEAAAAKQGGEKP